MLENIKKRYGTTPLTGFAKIPSEDIWSYYELLWINLIVFDYHLAVILQEHLVDKSLIRNMYKVYNFPILHPVLQKTFWYSVEVEYLPLTSNSNYVASHQSETCLPAYLHRDTALYPTEKVSWCLYTLFLNDIEQIRINCNCEVEMQTHNVIHNLNRNVWPISALTTEKLYTWCLQKTYYVNVKPPSQFLFLSNAYDAYRRNMYFPAIVVLMNNDPTLTWHK